MVETKKADTTTPAKADATPKGKGVTVRMRERSYGLSAGQEVTVSEETAQQLVSSRVAHLPK